MSSAYIAALDVGTTSVRCFILNNKCEVIGSAIETVTLLNPQPGYFEIEPESLWEKIISVIRNSVQGAKLRPSQITCLGISTQRCTFLTWNHHTQEYYHNFITWKDLRSNALVDQWNESFTLKTLNNLSYMVYLITRNRRFLAGSVLKMMNGQVTLRLLHEIQKNPRLQCAIKEKRARVELLDSWILYKLRSGNGLEPNVEHITDITSCTATGLFDPFTLNWSSVIKHVFGINLAMLPKIVDNDYQDYGQVHPSVLGDGWEEARVAIALSVSDQTAAIWGSQCFQEGDVKITMGTGAFLNLVTGGNCHASIIGMYPLVAWQFQMQRSQVNCNDKTTMYCMEGAAYDMGTIIEWGQQCGLYNDPNETAELANSVPDTCGVYFVPAFSGLGPPVNDHRAGSGFIGITPATKRAHLVRAMLESIVFRLIQLCDSVERETNFQLRLLKVDGGVSRNDFVCQFLADASKIRVERAKNIESSVMGTAYMAGLKSGIWSGVEELKQFRIVDRIFEPRIERTSAIREHMSKWRSAIDRLSQWY